MQWIDEVLPLDMKFGRRRVQSAILLY